MDVVVTGIGLQSCLGSLERSWASILRGKSGIKVQQPFTELSPYPLGSIEPIPTRLSSLTELIVKAAIADAKLQVPLTQCGVAIGSSRGCQNVWEEVIKEQGTRSQERGTNNKRCDPASTKGARERAPRKEQRTNNEEYA